MSKNLTKSILASAVAVATALTATTGPVAAQLRSIALEKPQLISQEQRSRFTGIVRQTHPSSCGFAALATIMNALGDGGASEEALIRQWQARHSDDRISDQLSGGVSMGDLLALATERGYTAHAYKIAASSLSKITKPVIVLINRPAAPAHFVVLKGMTTGRVHLADSSPGLGHVYEDESQFVKQWGNGSGTGIVLLVERAGGSAPGTSPLMVGAAGIEEASVSEALLRDHGRLHSREVRATLELNVARSSAYQREIGIPNAARASSAGAALALEYGISDTASIWGRLPIERTRNRIEIAGSTNVEMTRPFRPLVIGLDTLIAHERPYAPSISAGTFLEVPVGGNPAGFGTHVEVRGTTGPILAFADVAYTRRTSSSARSLDLEPNSIAGIVGVRYFVREGVILNASVTKEFAGSEPVGVRDPQFSIGATISLTPTISLRPTFSYVTGAVPSRAIGIGIVITSKTNKFVRAAEDRRSIETGQ